ncbi:unnamed protein product [Amoebophrya sp. A25]|nr:unnamed protein product [Amoebophrya sp. A25]|eukprot:GSA25T00010474001.1
MTVMMTSTKSGEAMRIRSPRRDGPASKTNPSGKGVSSSSANGNHASSSTSSGPSRSSGAPNSAAGVRTATINSSDNRITDQRRLTTIKNLAGKGIASHAALWLERGICEKSCRAKLPSANKTEVPTEPTLFVNNRQLSSDEYKEYTVEYRRVTQFLRSNPSLLARIAKEAAATAKPLSSSGQAPSIQAAPGQAPPSNPLMSMPRTDVELFAFQIPFRSNAELESKKMTERRVQLEEQAMHEAMAVDPKDDPRWSLVRGGQFKCEKCGSEEVLMLATVSTNRKEDQSDEPVLTLRCSGCGFLWKETDGETFAG